METMAGMHRSCGCGRVTEKDCGKELTLAGWVNTRRDHGGLIFIDLRDRSGIVQVVMSPQYGEDAFPVSYTHLDVYKRQFLQREFPSLGSGLMITQKGL